MNFDNKYFSKFNFNEVQIKKNLENALKDMNIAIKDEIIDVKFNYAYSSLLKAGIALLSYHQIRIKSVPGHHVKIIETLAETLKDKAIADVGNAMRSKRNIDMYSGGVEVTEKESKEYIDFVDRVLSQVKAFLNF